MTQTAMIMEYINTNGGITAKEAADHLGCMRLAARIADLERQGQHFHRERVEAKNRFGDRVFFTRYSFGDE